MTIVFSLFYTIYAFLRMQANFPKFKYHLLPPSPISHLRLSTLQLKPDYKLFYFSSLNSILTEMQHGNEKALELVMCLCIKSKFMYGESN